MAVRLYAMTCGWLTMPLGFALKGEQGTIRVPVPCYLVDHPRGKLLFDSGLHLETLTEPVAYLGAMADYFQVHFEPGEEISARLKQLEIDLRDLRYLVNSHLHFDHAGGNAQIPDAPVVIQRREWEAGRDPELIERGGYKPSDYDLGQDVIQVDGEHDLFGDGSVVCLPTYGHTPGHQSLHVRLEGGEVILTGDACYLRRTLEELALPPILHDAEEMTRSLEKLRTLQARGARIFYGHDPEFWRSVPQAPAPIV
jgi:glyoxylase-like metal-dependent hydrolase (beta-lactamase superfamily II)